MQTIGLAEFRTSSSGGLVLSNFKLTELLADPAAEGSRVAQLKIAVQEMFQALKLKPGRVNYAIPAQSVFTRFVKLPSVEADQVEQIITFEAQQNVPFPINEVVWDYQLVGGQENNKMEVVLVAIKADLLDELNDAVEDFGLKTNVVDVAPMALYNAFRYNYSDMSGCSLLIDIGSRTTNLIFVEPNKVFSRSIPIGGSTVTGAIAKEFNEPFGAAEERKKAVGFVSLGGAYAEANDPDVARVSKMIRNSMTRLHSEISRSISFYRSQQGGSQPARVFLCGGSTSLSYMREFFAEKLQLPIEFFNPLRNVTVSNDVNMDEAGRGAHLLGELVGLSLRSITDCPMELNLQPASVVRAQSLSQKRPYIVLAGVCLLLSLAGWWIYYQRATQVESAVIGQLEQKIAPLKQKEAQFQAANREIQATKATAAPFLEAVDERSFWPSLIDDLNAKLPSRFIWITEFEPMQISADRKMVPLMGDLTGKPAVAEPTPETIERPAPGDATAAKPTLGLRLHGLYLDNQNQAAVVDEFAKKLEESPFVGKVTVVTRGTPTQTEWAYDYELQLELKKAISTK
ncbi:MAG: type pilus assembly protein PilM [Chthoniobacter sp.]|nr:type pilus assembly protein PilM [Chthoniobacter sp.]